MQLIRRLIEREADLTPLDQILKKIPGNTIERYMRGAQPGRRFWWEKWANEFLDFYAGSSDEERKIIAADLFAQREKQSTYLTFDMFVVEVLRHFGETSPHFSLISELFHALVPQHQSILSSRDFQKIFLQRLHNSDAFLKDEIAPYDTLDRSGRSREIQVRLQHILTDEQWENNLSLLDFPQSSEEMFGLLSKMAKGKIGLPHRTDFLAAVVERFHEKPHDWDDVRKGISKLRHSQPEWHKTQIYTLPEKKKKHKIR